MYMKIYEFQKQSIEVALLEILLIVLTFCFFMFGI